MASSHWWMVCHQWLGRHLHLFFLDLDHWSNHLLQPLCLTTFSRWCKVPHQQLGRLFHPFFWTWTIVWIIFCSRHAQWLPLVGVGFVINSLVSFSICFFWTWCNKRSCQAQLRPSNRGQWFHVWKLFVRKAHGYDNQWNLALMEAGVVSKMQTPTIPLWFPKKWLFGFFILEKQLTSQNIFLVKSELSLTTYLFLLFYKSTLL